MVLLPRAETSLVLPSVVDHEWWATRATGLHSALLATAARSAKRITGRIHPGPRYVSGKVVVTCADNAISCSFKASSRQGDG